MNKLQEAAADFLIKRGVDRNNIAPEVLNDFAEFATEQSKEAIQELVSALDYGYRYIKTMPESPLRTRLLYNYDKLIQKHKQ